MKSLLILLLFSFVLSACRDKQVKINHPKNFYVISAHEKSNSSSDSIAQAFVYCDYNFVLLDSSSIYFYKFKEPVFMDIIADRMSNPPFIKLLPEKLQKMEIAELEKQIKGKQLLPEAELRNKSFSASISYPEDTVKHKAFATLFNHLKSNNVYFSIRRCTQEELAVTEAIIKKTTYDPMKVRDIIRNKNQ